MYFLIFTVKYEDQNSFNLMNIYAPNNVNERKDFYKYIINYLSNTNNNTYILGDFNCTISAQKDRYPSNNSEDGANYELTNLISTHDMFDVWRKRNPDKNQYTFKRGNSQSRIDMILAPNNKDCDISKADISKCIYSDHSVVSISITIEDIVMGPGTWKMNIKTIQSEQFKDTFQTFWAYWKGEIDKFDCITEWWEIGKKKIKEITMDISKMLNKGNREIKRDEEKLELLLRSENPNNAEINDLKTKLKDYYKNKTDGLRIRSRIKHFEENEKSTRYFFNLEKSRAKSKLWRKIKLDNGNYSNDITTIIKEQVKFYTNLFSSEGWNRNSAEKLLENVDTKLTNEEKEDLECPITETELWKCIKQLKKNKSPGEDGIISELIKEILDSEKLSHSQSKGILTLLYKKGEREDIKNWRPLTLLNVDYKIVSKLLANRIKPKLCKLSHPDQRGFVPGRSIHEANRLIQDIIDYANMRNDNGFIIFLDQEKAFDRVEWEWLDACLIKYNF